MGFRNTNIDPFEVNAFHITGLFSRRSCGCHSHNQFENLLLREEKEQPVDILIDYEQLLFPSSICRSNKQTQKMMLRFTGILYTHATDQVEKEEIYQVYNFNFCNMDLSANSNIWT